MTVGVIPNTGKDEGFCYTRAVCEFLIARGAKPLLEQAVAEAAGIPACGVPTERLYLGADFWVVLGGDGTMLRAARHVNGPILGINLGNLGYLTDADRHNGFAALTAVLEGRAKEEKRMMLSLYGGGTERFTPDEKLALNDICVSRGGFGKLIAFSLYINGLYMDTMRADGVIVATPTGSTAYNLSAGGPVLAPDGEMMAVTAICPHELYTRPLVINAKDTVEIRPEGQDGSATISLDGEPRYALKTGESVCIRRSVQTATILKTSDRGFFEILRNKFRQVSERIEGREP